MSRERRERVPVAAHAGLLPPAIIPLVIPPFDRSRLRERNLLDEADARADAAALDPARRLEQALELSAFVLAHATGADGSVPEADLADKARLYASPLRLLATRR